MKRHDDSQRNGRLAVKQPVYPIPPTFLGTEKQLTAPAHRPVRAPAHAVALPGDRNVPDPHPLTAGKTHPALPATQIRCFADHHPVWGCDAGAHVRRAVGAGIMGAHTSIHKV